MSRCPGGLEQLSGQGRVHGLPVSWDSFDPKLAGHAWTIQQRVVCGVFELVDLVGMASILTIGVMYDLHAATVVDEIVVEEGYVEMNKKVI